MKLFTTSQVKGLGRGSKILVPTINLAIPPDFTYAHGIYAGHLILTDKKSREKKQYAAAIHYGKKPTFTDKDISLEANLVDIEPQNLIGYDAEHISIALVSYIRPVQIFIDAAALLREIHNDIRLIKQALAKSQVEV